MGTKPWGQEGSKAHKIQGTYVDYFASCTGSASQSVCGWLLHESIKSTVPVNFSALVAVSHFLSSVLPVF